MITKEMLIEELVKKHPEAAEVLFNHGLHCLGCSIAAKESLEQGCRAHGMGDSEIKQIVEEINEKIK